MATTRRDMGKRRTEKTVRAPLPPVPPSPPKGKKGSAAKTRIARTKEPLRSAQKVKA